MLAGVADATPKSGDGEVEMIRMLKSVKDSVVKARTQAVNQMKAPVVTAPAELRETPDGLSIAALATRCARFRPGRPDDPTGPAKYALSLPRLPLSSVESRDPRLAGELSRLTRTASSALVGAFGIGPHTAAAMLVVTPSASTQRLPSPRCAE